MEGVMDLELARQRLNEIYPKLNEDQKGYMDEAIALIEEAEKRKIPMRLLGSTAFLLNCPNHVALYQAMERPLTDIDLVAYLKQDREIEKMLDEMGYVVKGGRGVTMGVFLTRMIFVHKSGARRSVDVFYDKLDFCHPIEFKNRLDLSGFYTITLADLLLEKMQIVEINEKDLKDTVMLLLEHEFGTDEKTTINLDRITRLLAEDWGFYHTFTTNLNKVKAYGQTLDVLRPDEKARLNQQVDRLEEILEMVPKSLKWKMRARVGTKKRWYNEVGEGYREIASGNPDITY
jgi:hypothetical protein